MKRILYLATLSVLFLTVGLSQDPPTNAMAPRGNQGRFFRQLKLTDSQRKDIEKLRFDLRKSMIDRQAQIKTDRLELAQLFRADNPDADAVEKKVTEISQLQSQSRVAAVHQWFSINKLLTPDQQKTWKKALGQFIRTRQAMRSQMRRNTAMRRSIGRQGSPREQFRNGMGR